MRTKLRPASFLRAAFGKDRLLWGITLGAALALAVFLWLLVTSLRGYQSAIVQLAAINRMEQLLDQLRFFDEVLTMSARMSAATDDPHWAANYRRTGSRLNEALQETVRLAPAWGGGSAAAETNAARAKLAARESRVFELVRQGRKAEALQFLAGNEFQAEKRIYTGGAEEVRQLLKQTSTAVRARRNVEMRRVALAAAIGVPLLTLGWLLVFQAARRRRAAAVESTRLLLKQTAALTGFKAALDEHAIVTIVDAGGKITYVNDKFCAISRYSREELIGQDHRMVNSGYHPKALFRELWQTITDGRTWRCEIRNRAKDGTFYWVDTTIVPFRWADRTGGAQYIAIQADITTRKQAEADLLDVNAQLQQAKVEADAANQAKSRFLANMSHEIRTPMNAILGYSQLMLRDSRLGPDAQENLKIMNRSGEHLLALINAVLDMSKIEAGRMEIHPATFRLAELFDSLVRMFRLRADAKGLRFDVVLDGESVPYVVADQGKLRQVLVNLLGNAVKFTQRGHVRLHATLSQRSANRLWLCASVEDTGLGMAEEEQEKLFQPFTQTGRNLNTQQGTGLGLAISREYARLIGGDLTCTSEPGAGSLFRLEVPVERGDARVAAGLCATQRVMGIRAGQQVPTVLVVDDLVENRDWLVKLLTMLGFSVRAAENGEAAIRIWEEWQPRLILMDGHMPVMDGLEATRRIKADPRGKETTIIALTASAMDDQRQEALQSGADDFVAKPCHEDDLLEKVRHHLNIAYDYKELGGNESEPVAGMPALSAEELGQMPKEWIEGLHRATLSGNKSLMDKLILEARDAGHVGSAHGLQALADNYEYDALTQLLEESRRG